MLFAALAFATLASAKVLPPAPLLTRLRSYQHPILKTHYTAPSTFGVRISPSDFGGDPLGIKDSYPALTQCVQFCQNYSLVLDPYGHFPGDASFGDGKFIANAGGCEIDLAGGQYKLSQPVYFPEFLGNLRLGHGSLFADDTPGVFPPDSFLIVVGKEGSCKYPQGSCAVDLGFPELFLDGSHVASGMQINNVMGTTIGPGGYFLNFSAFGIQINAGHEVMVDRCWLGETNFDYPFSEADPPKAIAIQINGNDHYILNTIVFSSKIGLEVNGAADYIQGVHVWFPMNRALAFLDLGVMAFHTTQGQNRFSGCYIDGSRAVFEGNGLKNNVWDNGFECCAGSGLGGIPHGIQLLGDSVGPGLHITHNIFEGGSIFSTPLTNGTTVKVTDVLIEGNSYAGGGQSSKATLSITGTAQTQWEFNFCPLLIFPTIARVQSITVLAASGVPVAVARPPVGCTLEVETSTPVTGTITVSVDSSVLGGQLV